MRRPLKRCDVTCLNVGRGMRCRSISRATRASRRHLSSRSSPERRPRAQYSSSSPSDGGRKGLRSIIKHSTIPRLPSAQRPPVLRRKQQELATHLAEYGDDVIEDRLGKALQTPNPNPHRLAQLVQSIKMTEGRPILIFELDRSMLKGKKIDEGLPELAQKFEAASADCLCVSTDTGTSEGIKDVFTISRAVKIPVLARDWYLHPLQILEAKEAGAAGVLGVIALVTVHGTPLLSGFAAAIGIDAPVEVVNLSEVKEMTRHGVSLYCVNCSVGLALSGIAGITSDITEGILQSLPFGAASVVGIKKLDDVRDATYAGADALLLKHKCLQQTGTDLREFIDDLKYRTSRDD